MDGVRQPIPPDWLPGPRWLALDPASGNPRGEGISSSQHPVPSLAGWPSVVAAAVWVCLLPGRAAAEELPAFLERIPAPLRAVLEEPRTPRTVGLVLGGLALLWGAARLARLLRASGKRAGLSPSSLRRAARRAGSRGDHLEAARL